MMSPDDPRELLAALEAQGDCQDALMRRLVDNLRDMIQEREALEVLMRRQTLTLAARTAFIAEAAGLLIEAEERAEVVELARYRRPKLRLVR